MIQIEARLGELVRRFELSEDDSDEDAVYESEDGGSVGDGGGEDGNVLDKSDNGYGKGVAIDHDEPVLARSAGGERPGGHFDEENSVTSGCRQCGRTYRPDAIDNGSEAAVPAGAVGPPESVRMQLPELWEGGRPRSGRPTQRRSQRTEHVKCRRRLERIARALYVMTSKVFLLERSFYLETTDANGSPVILQTLDDIATTLTQRGFLVGGCCGVGSTDAAKTDATSTGFGNCGCFRDRILAGKCFGGGNSGGRGDEAIRQEGQQQRPPLQTLFVVVREVGSNSVARASSGDCGKGGEKKVNQLAARFAETCALSSVSAAGGNGPGREGSGSERKKQKPKDSSAPLVADKKVSRREADEILRDMTAYVSSTDASPVVAWVSAEKSLIPPSEGPSRAAEHHKRFAKVVLDRRHNGNDDNDGGGGGGDGEATREWDGRVGSRTGRE